MTKIPAYPIHKSSNVHVQASALRQTQSMVYSMLHTGPGGPLAAPDINCSWRTNSKFRQRTKYIIMRLECCQRLSSKAKGVNCADRKAICALRSKLCFI